MTASLDWARDSAGWPHREASRFVEAGGLRWHVQQMGPPPGAAPTLLLIHGTGASTHSWRGVAPLLAEHFHVLAADLPGHGFTAMPVAAQTMSLPGMAQALGALLARLDIAPKIIIGHSAGAAIGARMCLDGRVAAQALVGINGAWLPPGGTAGRLFSPVAKLLALNPWVPRLFSWRASEPAAVRRLLGGTGSVLDADGVALYARLVRSPGHVAGALAMMANWDLAPLVRELPQLRPRLLLLTGSNDRTLPPAHAQQVAAWLPSAQTVALPGLGHLAHEEQPQRVVRIVVQWARDSGVVPVSNLPAEESPP